MLSGGYNLRIDICVDVHSVFWNNDNDKKKGQNYQLKSELLQLIRRELITRNVNLPCNLHGHTILTSSTGNGKILFRAHPHYHGRSWYDWAFVAFLETNKAGIEEERLYPSKLIGFIQFPNDPISYAAVQCSTHPLLWEHIMKKFIVEFNIGVNFNVSFVFVPVSAIVHPCMTFQNYGSKNSSSFFVVLPKRNWSKFFSSRLAIPRAISRKVELQSGSTTKKTKLK
jgi:hypothetical protein